MAALVYSTDFLPELKTRLGAANFGSEVVALKIVHEQVTDSTTLVMSEVTTMGGNFDHNLSRTNLDFVTEDYDQPMFDPEATPDENARVFLERMDLIDIANCVPGLLSERGEQRVSELYKEANQPVTAFDLRDDLVDMVRRDLLGPAGGEDEELDQFEDRVSNRYLVGALAPREKTVAAEVLDTLSSGGADTAEEGAADVGAPAQTSLVPNSLGLSFVVDKAVKTITLETSWGRYHRVASEVQEDKAGKAARVWKREPVRGELLSVALTAGSFGPLVPYRDYPDVTVYGKVRAGGAGWIVTVFLVNGQLEPERSKDSAWVFQPKLRVLGPNGVPAPIFVQRHDLRLDLNRMDALTKTETEALGMLYRNRLDFAVGHGCSVHVTVSEYPERALLVESEFMPEHDVPVQTPPTPADNPELEGVVLDMKLLAEMPDADLFSSLNALTEAYKAWIERERAKPADPNERLDGHENAVARAVKNCEDTLSGMSAGIRVLQENADALKAFRFANRTMYLQRVRTLFAREVRKGVLQPEDAAEPLDLPRNRSWRLFQLAFVLLNVESLMNLHAPQRSHPKEAVVDLLWFATGGGKTEAYLGLTAYTLAMRRLQGMVGGRSGEHGVGVLMRYTLRLLTLQQFQRAAALICACEVLRREDPKTWGTEPFRLGLWVGAKATPNRLKDADESLASSNMGGRPNLGGSPHQLTNCPWCGRDIKPGNLKVYQGVSEVGRCVTYCSDKLGRCAFSGRQASREGIPVMVVDEEIYRRPPSLLIATVDKFAQMAWRGETQMLFGVVNGLCPRHGFLSPDVEDSERHPARNGLPAVTSEAHPRLRPPDLIIQDELHLISGPLGSMVGLYETAVDELCSWELDGRKVRPKVIASTATIRRAAEQVKKLYARDLRVFPPQGTDIKDSFFAVERAPDRANPGRRYLGICAFGKRYTEALIRVYLVLLAGGQRLFDDYDELADPYMTLVGYFNAIRELAGAKRLSEDEIGARLRDAGTRGLAPRRLRFHAIEELTSRKSGTEIPGILNRLEVKHRGALEAERKAAEERREPKPPYPYDIVLATNMISVGVDVERLGLMVVANQPKTTSEYIQASSRVGRNREAPGLVCTVYNWARPRDLSHFENFEHYHDTFYKHVEALSVTPYSARALDKGLAGVFVGFVRLMEDHLNANGSAGNIDETDTHITRVMTAIAERAEHATGDTSVRAFVEAELNSLRDKWLDLSRNRRDSQLVYKAGRTGGNSVGLLKQPGEQSGYSFTALNSLRDVETTAKLLLDDNAYGLNLDYRSTWDD